MNRPSAGAPDQPVGGGEECFDSSDAQEATFDAIVLGAGISGLVSAAILLDRGASRVLLVDEYPRVGGNHLDRRIDGYTFDVGSLIFQNDSPLLRWFPELMQSYVPIEPSWSRLNPQGVVTEYPLSVRDDLVARGPVEIVRFVASVISARIRLRPPRNALEFAQFWVGPRLARHTGLEHYMERFCGVSADHIELQFAVSRMGWIADHAKIRTQLRRLTSRWRRHEVGGPANQQLARPRSGFAELYDPVAERLERQGARFALGERPDRLERVAGGFALHVNGRVHRAEHVISTIPVDHTLRLIASDADPLPTVTLLSLFYSFSGARGFSTSVLYNFSTAERWKRLTVYSDFYGPAHDREYFTVEVIHDETTTVEQNAERFEAHATRNGLFSGDLRLEGSHILRHAYPIYTEGSAARAKAGIDRLRSFGVESFGRQGGFEYQPTSRTSTQSVESALGVGHVSVAPIPPPNGGDRGGA